MFGTIFGVVSGLPIGKEGPMVHMGSIIAAGLSQGKSTISGYDTSFSYFIGFRNDREKRDFCSCGAAGGVAAAFGAPIGGVLFVLEEGASFWDQKLTWRTFFCAMISTFTLTIILSAIRDDTTWGKLGSLTGTFSFGTFQSSTYELWEIPLFVLMGIGGGILGALFNFINTKLFKLRSRWITTKCSSVIEVCLVTIIVSTTGMVISWLFGNCQVRPSEYMYKNSMIQFLCKNSNEYNNLATLFLTSGENAIKQLFHAPPNTFYFNELLLFWLSMFFLTCITYGMKIPSGLFVPLLLIGAAYGRLWTIFINSITKSYKIKIIDPRIYGLIGSAAMLGGCTRMTISLTIILLECTGNIQYGLPLIATLFSARWIGNIFNDGIYDIHIHLRHLPFLDWNPPVLGTFLRVKHVMTRNPKSFQVIERAGVIYDTLMNSTHNGFPVINDHPKFGKNFLSGFILRKQLTMILFHRDFTLEKPTPHSRKPYDNTLTHKNIKLQDEIIDFDHFRYCLSYRQMEKHYPRYPRIGPTLLNSEVQLSKMERKMWVDLSPYMNETPFLIQENAAFTRAYRLFRNSGLRHLIVVNKNNNVNGLITRKDLDSEHCSRCFRLANGSFEKLYPSSPAMLPSSITSIKSKIENSHQIVHRNRDHRKDLFNSLNIPLLSLNHGSSDEEILTDDKKKKVNSSLNDFV